MHGRIVQHPSHWNDVNDYGLQYAAVFWPETVGKVADFRTLLSRS